MTAGDHAAEHDPEAERGQVHAASSEPAETQGVGQVPGKTGPPREQHRPLPSITADSAENCRGKPRLKELSRVKDAKWPQVVSWRCGTARTLRTLQERETVLEGRFVGSSHGLVWADSVFRGPSMRTCLRQTSLRGTLPQVPAVCSPGR